MILDLTFEAWHERTHHLVKRLKIIAEIFSLIYDTDGWNAVLPAAWWIESCYEDIYRQEIADADYSINDNINYNIDVGTFTI